MQPEPSSQVEPNPLPQALARGYRSTEFWVTLVLIALDFALAIQGMIPADHAVGYATVTASVYKALRIWLKIRHGQLTIDQAFIGLELKSPVSKAVEDLGSTRPPGSGVGVGPVLLVLGALFLVLGLSGCGSLANGTRVIESVEATASGTYDAATGGVSGTVGGRVYFRDGRDAKTIKPLSLRTSVLELETLGPKILKECPYEGAGSNAGNEQPSGDDDKWCQRIHSARDSLTRETGLVVASNCHCLVPSAGPADFGARCSIQGYPHQGAPKAGVHGGNNETVALNHGAAPSGAMVRGGFLVSR